MRVMQMLEIPICVVAYRDCIHVILTDGRVLCVVVFGFYCVPYVLKGTQYHLVSWALMPGVRIQEIVAAQL